MRQRNPSARFLAAVAIAALLAPWYPTHAESTTAEIDGVIRSLERTPLEGVRLLATDPDQGRVHASRPTGADGRFRLTGLRPGTYELAVDVGGGLFIVKDSLYLVGGVKRTIQISVGADPLPDGSFPAPADGAPTASAWNNPASAALIVLGIAVAVGVLVENVTEDELASTQFRNN